MMKKQLFQLSLIAVTTTLFLSFTVALTVRCYNKDSESHTFKVKIAGSTKEVTFDKSSTTSVTIQGGSDTAIISCKCGDVEVEAGDYIEIKDGCITVK